MSTVNHGARARAAMWRRLPGIKTIDGMSLQDMELWRTQLTKVNKNGKYVFAPRTFNTVATDTYRELKQLRAPQGARGRRRQLSNQAHRNMVVSRYVKQGVPLRNAHAQYNHRMSTYGRVNPGKVLQRQPGGVRYYGGTRVDPNGSLMFTRIPLWKQMQTGRILKNRR